MSFWTKVENKILHPGIGWIWCLHRVVPQRSLFKDNRDLEITPDFLEDLIVEKRRQGFHFVDLDTFVASASGFPWKRKMIHVTFDDGFEDVYVHAYPIFKKYQIPFTFYISTDFPDRHADLWWLQLEHLAHGDSEWFKQIMRQVYRSEMNPAEAMHTLTGSEKDASLCHRLSISWEQLRIMVSEGLCSVGSHGVSHSAMPSLSKEDAQMEMQQSKCRLKEMLGVEIRHFSYPYSKFNDATNQCVWKSGYQTAVLGYGGATRYSKGKMLFFRDFIIQP